MSKILIIEDDKSLCNVLLEGLRPESYSVEVANDGADALARLLQYSYDLIILDWELPFINGLEICQRFRGKGGHAPILMLTAKSKLDEKETGFDAGVDDYLTKPFELRELRSRIKALLRRPKQLLGKTLTAGGLVLDPQGRHASIDGSAVHLSPKEFDLLEYFLCHRGVVLSAEQLLNAIWNADDTIGTETVRTHVKTLRAKIDKKGESSSIVTIFAVGYKFDPPV